LSTTIHNGLLENTLLRQPPVSLRDHVTDAQIDADIRTHRAYKTILKLLYRVAQVQRWRACVALPS